jgi:hypothetical protein
MRVWMLTKFYDCPEFDWRWPVCHAYGFSPYCPMKPADPDGFALVKLDTTPQHVEAIKQDPRVIYCGKDYDAPPKELLALYAGMLDPAVTYMFLGQVIARLAQQEPAFYHDPQDPMN